MNKLFIFIFWVALIAGCNRKNNPVSSEKDNPALASLLDKYYHERMKLYPLESTMNGEPGNNNLLPADFTDAYRATLKNFFSRYQQAINIFDTASLNENDRKSYDIFKYETDMGLGGLAVGFLGSSSLNDLNYMPFDQFNGVPLLLGQMGGGTGNQPFKTVEDYDDWLKRAALFPAWSDSAIVYFKKGMAKNILLPKMIVIKMIPEMTAMITDSATKSIFYGPVSIMPASFTFEDKKRLAGAFQDIILNKLIPSYKKLAEFLKNEYLPAARGTSGINALPGGDKLYAYLVRYWTTTDKTPLDIYNTGLSEVKRIRSEMEQIKDSVKFQGDLNAFFTFMKTDKRFMPYKSADEIIAAFYKIEATMKPNLDKMFTLKPRTKFEIRQTESFRAASASAEYYPGLPDGTRPGIFYVPVVDATKFNTTGGMESLFLHEAIPGHHYQMSIQSENDKLPAFRRFIWYGAYGEGYALYCESLGKELGLYTDPYQHMGALGDEIHRAIRLVVDVAIHTGKMNREEAIKYMTDNEAISQDGAVAEIERYMVFPAQALSYKTGALKIRELREKYRSQLGTNFSLPAFHAAFLKGGCMPLEVIERSMDVWAKQQAK